MAAPTLRIRLLGELWRAAQGGAGARLVLVTGEPGVGKSRLAEEFRSWCAAARAATAEARSYPARRGELGRLLPELRPADAEPPPAGAPDPERRRLPGRRQPPTGSTSTGAPSGSRT